MNIFLSYIVLGLSLSAPVGPVNAAQIDKGIKNGFWHAWIFGLGAMTADGLYMLFYLFRTFTVFDRSVCENVFVALRILF